MADISMYALNTRSAWVAVLQAIKHQQCHLGSNAKEIVGDARKKRKSFPDTNS